MFAGPLFNFLVAFVAALILVWACGVTLPVVRSVSEGSGAEQAGLQEGDVICSMNGSSVHLQNQVYFFSIVNRGEAIRLVYERDIL